jgi:hypothetical protein
LLLLAEAVLAQGALVQQLDMVAVSGALLPALPGVSFWPGTTLDTPVIDG